MGRPCQCCQSGASDIVSTGTIDGLSAPLIRDRLAIAGFDISKNSISRHIALHLGEPRGRGGRGVTRRARRGHGPRADIIDIHVRRRAEWGGWQKAQARLGEYGAADRTKRAAHLRRYYGLALADWEAMLEAQGGACAVCLRPFLGRRVNVDHTTVGGRVVVRGLLCTRCNTGIGMLGDGLTETLERALVYVQQRDTSEASA